MLLAVFPDGRKSHSRGLSLDLDKYRVHGSNVSENYFAENSIIRVPRPPDSPDLAPSDFWLFGYMKAAMAGRQFPGREDLLTGIQEFLNGIQRSELELVFHHWIECVQWVLDNDRDSFHE
jgi:hypothetical protein